MIFGKGLPPGESKPLQTIRKYEVEVEKAYNHLVKSGISASNGVYSIPKYVRINTLVTSLPEVLEDLEYLGVEQILYDESVSESEYLELVKNIKMKTFLIDKHFENLLVFHSDENFASWSLYQKGHVLIQDKSSYIPPYVLNPEPGSVVLDACAAPGMKTLHLASIMENKGALYAFERDKNRFKTLNNILQSGHTDIYQTFCDDFNSVDVNDEKFSSVEYILLDPSCSGSGMVNRMDSVTDTEESKNDARIQKLAGFQIILLKHALLFPSVKKVVYSTCSVTEQENEYVVHEALNHFRYKFKLTHVLPDWPIRGFENYEFGPLCLRAYPDKSLTNGFFVAMFERIDSFGEDEKFLSRKKTQKVKRKGYVEEKNSNVENVKSKFTKQKYVRDSQNDGLSFENKVVASFEQLGKNIDSNEKNSRNWFHKNQQQLFAEEIEIDSPFVNDSLKLKKTECVLEAPDMENSTTEQVPELHCKKRKKKHLYKDGIQENYDLNSVLPDETLNTYSLTKNNKKHKKTKYTHVNNDDKLSSSESVIELHSKNPKNHCTEFIKIQHKSEEGELKALSNKNNSKKHKEGYKNDTIHQDHNLKSSTNTYEEEKSEVFPKHKKSKKHKRDRNNTDSIDRDENLENPINYYELDEFPKHKKSKKHIKDRNDNDSLDQDHNLENPIINYEQENSEAVVKHKKSKKHIKDRNDTDSLAQDHNLEKSIINYAQEDSEALPKHKKSKKHKREKNYTDSIDQDHNLGNLINSSEQDQPETFPKHKESKHSKKHKRDGKESDSKVQINISLENSFSNDNETIMDCTSDKFLHKHRKKSKQTNTDSVQK